MGDTRDSYNVVEGCARKRGSVPPEEVEVGQQVCQEYATVKWRTTESDGWEREAGTSVTGACRYQRTGMVPGRGLTRSLSLGKYFDYQEGVSFTRGGRNLCHSTHLELHQRHWGRRDTRQGPRAVVPSLCGRNVDDILTCGRTCSTILTTDHVSFMG